MPTRPGLFVLALACAGTCASAGDYVTKLIPGRANIYGAGHATAPAPGGGGGGVLPTQFDISAVAGDWVEFSVISGDVSGEAGDPPSFNDPDGEKGSSTDVDSFGGISGIMQDKRSMFLVGVFLGADEPIDPAPAALDFSDNDNFEDISPELQQTFWVGDGYGAPKEEGGDGGRPRYIFQMKFYVPAGATRLFLGFAQSDPSVGGLPGFYDDNSGELEATLHVAPAPGFAGLLGAGLGAVGRRRRR